MPVVTQEPPHTIPWLKNVPSFAVLDEKAIEALSDRTTVVAFEDGCVIFEEGDPADAIYVLISGQVLIEKRLPRGRKKTLSIIGAGDVFGEMAAITGGERCAAAVAAEGGVAALRIERNDFVSALRKHNDLCFGLLQVLCQRLLTADDEITKISFSNLPGRVASKLLELAERFGQTGANGRRISLSLTHGQLAEMVGTNRESVSKYMSLFKKEGSIDIIGRHIIIRDQHKLERWG